MATTGIRSSMDFTRCRIFFIITFYFVLSNIWLTICVNYITKPLHQILTIWVTHIKASTYLSNFPQNSWASHTKHVCESIFKFTIYDIGHRTMITSCIYKHKYITIANKAGKKQVDVGTMISSLGWWFLSQIWTYKWKI